VSVAMPDPGELARRHVEACGIGRVTVVGARAERLARALRSRGCAAAVAELDGPATFADARHVLLVEAHGLLDDAQRRRLFARCRERGAVAVHLVVAAVGGDRSGGREAWEQQAIDAGFRKHPSADRVAPYESLDRPGATLELLFEPLSDELLRRFPTEHLQAERLLHMDMLREVGRRGDAHVMRYQKAAAFVRPGDAVLDVACGYGYGSHVLFHESQAASVLGIDLDEGSIDYANASYGLGERVRFRVGDAQALRDVPDASVDFIASFETIEHLPEPARYLDELLRVLKPSGRLFVCAPNDWSDETGEDPNPHHLHVYTWQRLRDELGARFLLERGFVQLAGGAMKCHAAPRDWSEVPLAPLEREAEWILLLAMKSPIGARDVPYDETAWAIPQGADDFHVSAFGRDYDNPWLVRAMVARGMRAEVPELLRAMQADVLADAGPTSVDHGAALCGRIHDRIGGGGEDGGDAVDELDEQVLRYAAIERPTPHQLRWQISLLCAIGELLLLVGDRDRARARFTSAAAIDPAPYSPLLGNRTLDARFRLAQMGVVDGDLDAARAQLLRSVEQARELVSGSWRNVIGDADRPLPFGPAELAQLLDRAARAAYALRQLAAAGERPGLLARESSGYFERLLGFADERAAALRRGVDGLSARVLELEQRLVEMSGELGAKEARTHELGAEVIELDRRAQELAQRVRDYQQAERATGKQAKAWFGRALDRIAGWFRGGDAGTGGRP